MEQLASNAPTKIVIPLGTGSKWGDNNELRYSLRSLNRDGVVLVGECPEWFTGDHIPCNEGGVATLNIWNKLKAACLSPLVSDRFIYANDDYFYLKPLEMANWYGTLINGNNAYKDLCRHTMRILKLNDLGTTFWDIHRPMLIDKAKFLECYEFFENHTCIGLGLIVKSCYGNYAGMTGIHMPDIKLAYWNGVPDCDMFSIGDGCLDVRFKAFCEERWPDKSIYEK